MILIHVQFLMFVLCMTVPVIYYGLQHYLSLAGSLVLIPLIMVPAMGGTDVRICVMNVNWLFHFVKRIALMHIVTEVNLFLHDAERYSKCCLHNAAGIWHLNTAAFVLWDSSSIGAGKLICLFGSRTSHYELWGVSQPYTACKWCFLLYFVRFNQLT